MKVKIKARILSPVHIASGDEYEKDFNYFIKDDKVYLIDEFKIVSKFKEPYEKMYDKMSLKDEIKNKIVDNKLYKRVINTNFNDFNKPLYENISSNDKPYIPASSIKGAIRTAILNCLVNYNKKDYSDRCENIYNLLKNKNFNCSRVNNTLDKDLEKIFRNIRIREVYPLFSTRIYKTINVKVCKDFQENREKTEEISNFIEAIEPKQEFIFEIEDNLDILKDIAKICNSFYIKKINDDIGKIRTGCIYKNCSNLKKDKNGFYYENYFYKRGAISTNLSLDDKRFLLNVSKFSGAVKKSIDNLRNVSNSKCKNKKYITTKTFALEKPCYNNLYENSLIPFGWILCDIQ